jgi:hypothetical protein
VEEVVTQCGQVWIYLFSLYTSTPTGGEKGCGNDSHGYVCWKVKHSKIKTLCSAGFIGDEWQVSYTFQESI